MEEFLSTDVTVSTAGGAARQGAVAVSAAHPLPVVLNGSFVSPNGRSISSVTTLDSLLSDDFGGSAINAANWDVLDGGLSANADLGSGILAQAKIGSGITGMSEGVASSALTVGMGTVLGAERWYLSKQVFAGKEDVLVILSKSQSLAANSIFIGMVEVDAATLVPLLNANIAADGNGARDFANRGGVEFGLTSTTTAFQSEAIGDSSSAKAAGNAGTALAVLSTTQEYLVEIDSRDIIVSCAAVDSVAARTANASRVSTQCPNDRRLYKLVMRFRNATTPGSNTNVVVQRVLVVDNYEQRVQVSSAEGDQAGCKGLAVNIANNPVLGAGANNIGNVTFLPSATVGAGSTHKLTAAATTNATNVKTSAGLVSGGYLRNRAATEKYFKFYNKASAPTVGTDAPVLTFGIAAGGAINLGELLGPYCLKFAAGIGYAITGAYADSDTTAVAAGDMDVNLIYS